jgi:hypothetical protein
VMLSDELWSKLEKILLQQTIYHKPDLRLTVEGMLYRQCHQLKPSALAGASAARV